MEHRNTETFEHLNLTNNKIANMIQPNEMKSDLPMEIANGTISSTTKVWEMLVSSYDGKIHKVKQLVNNCRDLLYAQYNYAPPIHFAVREGHTDLVKYFLDQEAFNPAYKTYPFLDDLITVARDRNQIDIAEMLGEYLKTQHSFSFKAENGKIEYQRNAREIEFETAVDQGDISSTTKILKEDPELIKNETFFLGEGIVMMPAKDGNIEMVELLLASGAAIPPILKWTPNYYFKHYEMAKYLMEWGMNPNTMSCHKVTLLHDISQRANIPKAELLIRHGAEINAIDEEYQSTPLGMAVRWDMPKWLRFSSIRAQMSIALARNGRCRWHGQ